MDTTFERISVLEEKVKALETLPYSVDISKISLSPSETLVVKIKGLPVDDYTLSEFQKNIKKTLGVDRVIVLSLSEGDAEFSTILNP